MWIHRVPKVQSWKIHFISHDSFKIIYTSFQNQNYLHSHSKHIPSTQKRKILPVVHEAYILEF